MGAVAADYIHTVIAADIVRVLHSLMMEWMNTNQTEQVLQVSKVDLLVAKNDSQAVLENSLVAVGEVEEGYQELAVLDGSNLAYMMGP